MMFINGSKQSANPSTTVEGMSEARRRHVGGMSEAEAPPFNRIFCSLYNKTHSSPLQEQK